MKKIYLSLLAVALCSSSFAQSGTPKSQPLTKKADINVGIANTVKPGPVATQKAVVLWSDNFSNMANWTLTNTGSAGVNWAQELVATTIPVAALSPFASTSVSDGYLFISSDANNTADLDGTFIIADATTATPINLTGEPDVVLSFEHNFRWWQDIREVRVSGDNGTTWTTFIISDASGNVTGAANQNTNNPEVTTFDISAVAGGSAQVLIQFHYDDQDYWGWYWAVDDVQILRKEANDLRVTSALVGSAGAFGTTPYIMVPDEQIMPVSFAAMVSNVGTAAQTNAILTATIDGGASTLTSATGVNIAPAAADSLFTTTTFTPAATIGLTHSFDLVVSADLVDAAPTDNIVADSMMVTNNIYARDRNVTDGGSFNNGLAYQVGNTFDIIANQDLIALDVKISTSSAGNPVIRGVLYSIDNTGTPIYVDETLDYTVTANNMTNGDWITMVFNSPIPLAAGTTYLLVAATYGDGGATNDFVVATSGTNLPQSTSYQDENAAWFFTTSTPMVRMNFDISLGIEANVENTMTLGQNYPNPFNSNSQINYSVKSNAKVNLTIVDMTGKVVMVINEGTKAAGDYTITLDASELAGGMYFYTLSNGTSSITKTMSVVK